MQNRGHILQITDLQTYFYVPEGVVKAVDRISFNLAPGEILGIVGESGCGKSVTALSILQLIDPPGKIVGGQILYAGENILERNEEQMRGIRGKRISMIFQDPMTSLNPLLTVGEQITEILTAHQKIEKKEALDRAAALLQDTGIPDPKRRLKEYPHQFSGGMRQRVMIASALACNPDIIIADEATTALDVTIQAQILEILQELARSTGTAVVLITHDLGIVAEMCDRILIMYTGRIIEQGRTLEIFDNPLHPYTRGLLNSLPERRQQGEQLYNIRGVVPVPIELPSGCHFSDRCERMIEGTCQRIPPPWSAATDTHRVYCHLYQDGKQ